MKKLYVLALLITLISCKTVTNTKTEQVLSDISLGTPFLNHMVLQQSSNVAIWGSGSAGSQVTIKASWGKQSNAVIDASGKWMSTIATPTAGGPYSIEVSSKNTIILDDVLIGEVWLASGQSNMEWPLDRTNDLDATLATLDCQNK
jgi:sialate O-acetylesterase